MFNIFLKKIKYFASSSSFRHDYHYFPFYRQKHSLSQKAWIVFVNAECYNAPRSNVSSHTWHFESKFFSTCWLFRLLFHFSSWLSKWSDVNALRKWIISNKYIFEVIPLMIIKKKIIKSKIKFISILSLKNQSVSLCEEIKKSDDVIRTSIWSDEL